MTGHFSIGVHAGLSRSRDPAACVTFSVELGAFRGHGHSDDIISAPEADDWHFSGERKP